MAAVHSADLGTWVVPRPPERHELEAHPKKPQPLAHKTGWEASTLSGLP